MRAPTLLLAIGGLVVVGLGVGLFVMTRVDAPPAPAPRHAVAAEGPPPAPSPEAAPVPAREPQARVAPPAPTHPSEPAPVLVDPPAAPTGQIEHDGKRDENGKLVPIVTVAQLRTVLHLTDEPMKACVDKANARPTGKATLSFTVASKDGKLVIESTGVDDEGTLTKYPELLACMHDTAHALKLEDFAVPELGTAIYVRRHVRLDAGAIAENSIFNFSYNPR